MDNATKEYWNEYSKADGPPNKVESVEYIDMDGYHDAKSQPSGGGRGPPRKRDEDGWDGKSFDKNKTDWGKSFEDKQYESDPNATVAESGYGKPSKGTYSSDLGGFKSFGTEGQGESPLGAKDNNDTTCGERFVLLSIRAIQDTSDGAASGDATSSAVHPVVMSDSSSYMTFEVGSYPFYDDVEVYSTSEENASSIKTSWMLLSVIALFMMSFSQ